MERIAAVEEAKHIMGDNLIGPSELSRISLRMGISVPEYVPSIPFHPEELFEKKTTHLLILGASRRNDGTPLTINALRVHFGVDPDISEPCFYNQDWYLKEEFASVVTLKDNWYLLKRELFESSRGISAEDFKNKSAELINLPTAIQCAFAFFCCYLLFDGMILWANDYVWCTDHDHNQDRIYVGRYNDPSKINKNGFSVHRHLAVRSAYGCLEVS